MICNLNIVRSPASGLAAHGGCSRTNGSQVALPAPARSVHGTAPDVIAAESAFDGAMGAELDRVRETHGVGAKRR
ncbi:hypothetical protein [Bosea sp. BK604]|uniref:hypothetical protein n=1 Tax=Bosea sp. BK604 TaxID=2512180 RepID=UPI00105122A2|nr:hypothetical protein [Bosea sp. BK604]